MSLTLIKTITIVQGRYYLGHIKLVPNTICINYIVLCIYEYSTMNLYITKRMENNFFNMVAKILTQVDELKDDLEDLETMVEPVVKVKHESEAK